MGKGLTQEAVLQIAQVGCFVAKEVVLTEEGSTSRVQCEDTQESFFAWRISLVKVERRA